jgi:hypothetical protein
MMMPVLSTLQSRNLSSRRSALLPELTQQLQQIVVLYVHHLDQGSNSFLKMLEPLLLPKHYGVRTVIVAPEDASCGVAAEVV